ncbi:MAG: class I SAM-dependent methyltransferase [Bacteroidia bacterium]|nr:class I SAM-dependent methyltransferase [Bacteroidia bacterium]
MTPTEAADLIRPAIQPDIPAWADLGAGTGVFTQALRVLLPAGTVYAVDKSPHMLWSLAGGSPVRVEVVEADFTGPFDLPEVGGMIMANALHYAPDPVAALGHILPHLRRGGTLVLVEYDTDRPNPPWVPYPVAWHRLAELAARAELSAPRLIARRRSVYGPEELYVAVMHRL